MNINDADWIRSHGQSISKARYHILTGPGTTVCGRKFRAATTAPRKLTQRQIDSQGCVDCVTLAQGQAQPRWEKRWA